MNFKCNSCGMVYTNNTLSLPDGLKCSCNSEEFKRLIEQYKEEIVFGKDVGVMIKRIKVSKEDIEKEVMAHEKTNHYLEGKDPKKVIVVPKRIVNIVV